MHNDALQQPWQIRKYQKHENQINNLNSNTNNSSKHNNKDKSNNFVENNKQKQL